MKKATAKEEERAACLRQHCEGTYRVGNKWPFCNNCQRRNFMYTLSAQRFMETAGIHYKLPASYRRNQPRKAGKAVKQARRISPRRKVAARVRVKLGDSVPASKQPIGTLVFTEAQIDRVIITMPFDIKVKAVQDWLVKELLL
jgi:hypothetical protein